MEQESMRPCPFCGGEAEAHEIGVTIECVHTDGTRDAYEMVAVGCVNEECPVMPCTKASGSVAEAVEKWNARAAVTDEQFSLAVHDGAVWQVVRECRFALEEDRDMLAEKAACGPGEFVTQDMPDLLWTCSACGEQYRNGLDALPGWLKHCPNCGAKVVV